VLALSGVYIAYYFFVKKPALSDEVKSATLELHQFWYRGWDFDALYNTLLVTPFVFISTINKNDVIDKFYTMLVDISVFFHRVFARTQNGVLRWYVMGIVVGAVLIITISLINNS
jgi:NADH-quinone oxidoreductase subunit L